MKVYVVIAVKVSNRLETTAEIFLSKSKADAFVEYFNSRVRKYRYEVLERKVCVDDFSKLS